MSSSTPPTSPGQPTSPTPPASLSSINHIIFLSQENRSLDHYFGAMRAYWAANGIPDQSFDGLPQFNPAKGIAPLQGPAPSIPGCDPNYPAPNGCVFDENVKVTSFHLQTECVENPSPSWDESHRDWDYNNPTGLYPAAMNGFVYAAGEDARNSTPQYHDVNGIRAMGYYDWTDLNYYYFMASNFGTSDRWFMPVLSRTQPNREYLIGGTTTGYVYPNGTDTEDEALIPAKTIFEELQNAGISWKIYVDPQGTACSDADDASCLMSLSYVQAFTYAQTIQSEYPKNIVPISQFFVDLQNGTLPQVAQIEPATSAGLDEHPTVDDAYPTNIQWGAQYVSKLINGLMQSSSWQDSVFILTWDENGGFYDHVPPQPAVNANGDNPVDLLPNDICTAVTGTGPTCDLDYTGFRIPLIVISPYAKKNYVSHTVADETAILKLIETRFNLPALTGRDAAQMDMTEFFNFSAPPWMTPPTPPAQAMNGACYIDHLP